MKIHHLAKKLGPALLLRNSNHREQHMRITIGVIIAIILIFYWYQKDHPQAVPAPVNTGAIYEMRLEAA
jgi:hypothetical protein